MERPYPFLSDDGGKFHLVPFITRHVRGASHCFGALNTPIVVSFIRGSKESLIKSAYSHWTKFKIRRVVDYIYLHFPARRSFQETSSFPFYDGKIRNLEKLENNFWNRVFDYYIWKIFFLNFPPSVPLVSNRVISKSQVRHYAKPVRFHLYRYSKPERIEWCIDVHDESEIRRGNGDARIAASFLCAGKYSNRSLLDRNNSG